MFDFLMELARQTLFDTFGMLLTLISSFIFYKMKTNALGLFSKRLACSAMQKDYIFGQRVKKALYVTEMFFLVCTSIVSLLFNKPFSEIVDTGMNYFGSLFALPVLVLIFSLIIMANPLEQMDIVTMFLPLRLVFAKLNCFFWGCCKGIPWDFGKNHNCDYYPWNVVPVQLIEASFAAIIFIILLLYRKKAKPGTLFPTYLFLYSFTRFFSEFLRYEHNVLGFFKTYHLLCLLGIIISLLMLLFVKTFGKRISAFFNSKHQKVNLELEVYENISPEKIAGQVEKKRKMSEERKSAKEREKKNKKVYSHSRKL